MTTLTTQLVHRPCRHSADLTLAMLLDRVPAALPFLVGPGFPPLAESLLRKRSAPRVTIRQAAETLPINLERLLTDLERLDDAEVAS